MARRRLGVGGPAWLGAALATACATGGGGALEPRYVAVHNALASMGLAQVGPIHQGVLSEGREARVSLDLPAGCATVVALGGDGLRDIDAQLVDVQGRPIAHDTTSEPQAVLHVCPEAPGAYVLVVRAAAGGGPWAAATWQGGDVPAATAGPPAAMAQRATGTCESPIALAAGTVSGSTLRGEDAASGSCERSDAREIVYELDVAERQRVVLEVEAHFDSVLYIRKDTCADADAEIDCNDDAPSGGRNHSRIERVLEPGKYFIFVDGYNQEAGSYKLTLSTAEVVSLGDVCNRAPALAIGASTSGTTSGRADDARSSCGGGAEGPEAAWRVDLPSRARVRVVEHSDDVSPVVHVRRACADEQSEVTCGETVRGGAGDAAVAALLEPGPYTVFADARDRGSAGAYSLLVETSPPAGSGVAGDGCGDALPLGPPGLSTSGDTFAARDDVSASCGGAGAADVVYRLDVPRRSRLVARLESEESPHLLAAWRRCGDRSSEIACGRGLDEVLSPGSYFVGVDGASTGAFGRFAIAWALLDLTAQQTACASAPLLAAGTTTASSAGAGDRFSSSCAGGGEPLGTGPDRVFRFALASRATVRLSLTTSGFDGTLALRRSCLELSGGASELLCASEPDGARRWTIERTLEPGSYWAIVDGQSSGDQGSFALDYRVVAER